ncbi:isochorismate synthase [Williamsia sp. M5A3_1d]
MLFTLSRPHGTVRARSATRQFSSAEDAVAAIATARSSGAPIAVVGALAFDPGAPDALYSVDHLDDSEPLSHSVSAATRFGITLHASIPAPSVHRARVARVIGEIGCGAAQKGAAQKVVLARAIEMTADTELDVEDLLTALAAGNPEHNAFAVDLSAAGPKFEGHVLVGASPESLVRRVGRTVTCHPYAGSAARSSDPVVDAERGRMLAASTKDHHEHRLVVEHLVNALEPFAEAVDFPADPVLLSTGEMWHLATPITATLRDSTMTSLDLARHLHPTPAICGTPTDVARRVILDTEEPRDFYAGAVGWCDETGDGEWMVSIRCAELTADRRSLRAWSGGGIVAESDPDDELAETTAKFGTILRALGCPDLLA